MAVPSQLLDQKITTSNSNISFFICRLIRLIVTLPVSTATKERVFSAMKLNKTRLRNKMEVEIFKKLLGTLY